MNKKNCILFFTSLIIHVLVSFPAFSEDVDLGVIVPLTGARADAGIYCKNALELGLSNLNASNTKYKIKLLIEDSRYEALAAVNAARKLIDADKVHFIIGPYSSPETLAVAPIAEQTKTIIITPGGQADQISSAGDYVFRLIHSSGREAPIFAEFVEKKVKGNMLPFLAIDNPAFHSYLTYFRPVFEKHGKKINMVEIFDPHERDFRSYLTKIKTQNPSDVFLFATPSQIPLILVQAKQLGLHSQYYNIGVEGPEILTTSNVLAEGLLYPYSFDAGSDASETKSFVEAYRAKYKESPDAVAANCYDALSLLSGCFSEIGLKAESVKNCLYGIRDYHGASGSFSIDQNGDATREIFVKVVKNGHFVRYTN